MNGRFLCLSRSLSVSLYMSLALSHSHSLSVFCLSHPHSLFSLSVSVSIGPMSVSDSVSLSPPNFLSGCKRLYNYSTMFYVLILSLFVCLSHSLTLFSLFLCFYMPVSDYLSVSHPHPRSLCLLICLSLSLFP